MLIVALVLAVIGLAALVAAVVTSNEILAWVCIAASSLGVILLVVDAVRERRDKQAARSAALAAAGEPTVVIPDGATEVLEDAVLDEEVLETAVLDEEVVETAVLDEEVLEDRAAADDVTEEAYPEEVVHDEPEFDTPGDDEPDYPESAEAAAIHVITEEELASDDLAGEELTEPEAAEAAADTDRGER